ncbi:MAG: hypothetical protein WB799_17905 [Candidatus Sulfotelmatobacter sp.]
MEKVYRRRDKLTRDVGKAGTSESANSIMEAMQSDLVPAGQAERVQAR